MQMIEAAEGLGAKYRPEAERPLRSLDLLGRQQAALRRERRALRIKSPRVVAGTIPPRRLDLECPVAEANRAARSARLGVAGLIGGAPAAIRGYVMILEISRRGTFPQEVEFQIALVAREQQADLAQRLDELHGEWSHPQREVAAPAAAESHRVLAPRPVEQRIAAHHVGVRIDPQADREKHTLCRTEYAEVITVISAVIRGRHIAERIGCLMHRKLIIRREHAVFPRAGCRLIIEPPRLVL